MVGTLVVLKSSVNPAASTHAANTERSALAVITSHSDWRTQGGVIGLSCNT
jgi:hypothetical protein